MKLLGVGMARYKHTDIENGQGIFITVNLQEQILPGTLEHMLNDIIGNKIDISMFDENYKNDETGCKAIPPAVLIKLIIYGYSKGIRSSRKLMELSSENMVAKALAGDMEPHWTTIASFVSSNGEKFQEIFVKVLAYCNELGLVGGETFAIDGLRLPSNASIDMSGTKAELQKRVTMYRKMAEKHVAKHRKQDSEGEMSKEDKRHYEERQKYLSRQIEKVSDFLENMEQREGQRGQEIKSNVTDNESAMIMSGSGFLQGYIGIAVSDKQNQIIVSAQAVGSANEGEHLPEILDKALDNMKEAGVKKKPKRSKPTFLADANYFSEENLKACQERKVEAIIPDSQYRRRLGANDERRFEAADFEYHKRGDYYKCPNGETLEYKRSDIVFGKQEGKVYQASAKDCCECPHASRCLRAKKDKGKYDRGRQLLITRSNEPESFCTQMRKNLSTEEYQNRYAYRIQIIEPVFANISNCKGLDRFTLRGKGKVNGQWKLYCIVHNLGKCLKEYNKGSNYA